MIKALLFGGVAALVFLGFFVPTFVLVFHGLAQKIQAASVDNSQFTASSDTQSAGTTATQSSHTPLALTSAPNTVMLNGKVFSADIVTSLASRELGLSYQQNLPANSVMLFVFPSASNWGIWMKGMNFPLDIFWLDKTGKVIYMKENVATSTYPTVFAPTSFSQAMYVIEADAGTAAATGVTVGTNVAIPPNLIAQN